MRPSRLAAACAISALLAAAPARAWRPFGEPSDGRIRPVQRLHDQGKDAEVLAALTPEFVQTLRGTDLRQAYVLMGDSHVALNRPAEALGDYQLGVGLFPKNVDLLTRLAALLHRNGLDEQARPLFLTALKYEPRHWTAHLGLAEIDHRFGFLDRSAEHYEIALESVDKRADVWRDYSDLLIAMNEIPTALLALQKALALEPDNPDAHVLLAQARRASGDLDAAADELDKALALGAGVGARRAKALLRVEQGRLDLARAEADAVLKEVPDDAAALWARARARLASGDASGAERDLSMIKAPDERGTFSSRAAGVLRARIAAYRAEREEALYRR